MSNCIHTNVSCVNPYEFIRKYRCDSCGEVMMCACEESFGRQFLPHQLDSGRELNTQREISVTLGFQKNICNSCRGIPEETHPMAPIYGRTSKLVRYYWREIYFEKTRRFDKWAKDKGYTDLSKARKDNNEKYDLIEREVIEEIKELHKKSPKYIYQEKSQSEILTKYQVEIIKLEGKYVRTSENEMAILDGNKPYSPEEFVARYFEKQGYKVIFSESVPFHVIFGVFMWLLIQDPMDPNVRMVGFGSRTAFDQKVKGEQIWTGLPEDFGTSGYPIRRAEAINEFFTNILNFSNTGDLLWSFDYWVEYSSGFRQYLWAHREQDLVKAREICSVLPLEVVLLILRYLLGDYWHRYLGWPDLIIYNSSEFFFAEVKSSKDKLSEDQKNWICGNSMELHLPFKLIKIHKCTTKE